MDDKLKFAVFIDYDNIEIGVKTTLDREFDVKSVLEGIKERGEVVAKIAYGNWSRHQKETRALSEHGVQMVQRDSSPRGDKNGADINLALDALEMAFTRDHINAFAIISGDSDFMALVNKLKQFNKRVYIVGGKAFTSTILQRNCHEFISYESLLDSQTRSRRQGQKARWRALPIMQAVPLVKRALSTLESRGVQPQLGLLKSNMVQLEPTFSERDYGVSSFSDFIRKLVDKKVLTMRTVDGHYVVEPLQGGADIDDQTTEGPQDAIPLLHKVLVKNIDLLSIGIPEKEVQALVRAAEPNFSETDYGFQEFGELLNLAQDKGLVRIESSLDQGLRCYPTDELKEEASKPPARKTSRRRRTSAASRRGAESRSKAVDKQSTADAEAGADASSGDAGASEPDKPAEKPEPSESSEEVPEATTVANGRLSSDPEGAEDDPAGEKPDESAGPLGRLFGRGRRRSGRRKSSVRSVRGRSEEGSERSESAEKAEVTSE